jgi:hypothetical protein
VVERLGDDRVLFLVGRDDDEMMETIETDLPACETEPVRALGTAQPDEADDRAETEHRRAHQPVRVEQENEPGEGPRRDERPPDGKRHQPPGAEPDRLRKHI